MDTLSRIGSYYIPLILIYSTCHHCLELQIDDLAEEYFSLRLCKSSLTHIDCMLKSGADAAQMKLKEDLIHLSE